MYSILSKSMSSLIFEGLSMNTCQIAGMHSRALLPRTSGSDETFLQPKILSPFFLVMISNIDFAWRSSRSLCGKKNMPTPYCLAPGSSTPCSFMILAKNLWGICVRIPTPSPVFPSASLPARCSRFSTMERASLTSLCEGLPSTSMIAPIPQLSCSNCGL